MISVIIPTYHEEQIIRSTVVHTLQSASQPIEVIVSDASGDDLTELSRGPARYVRSEKGRGIQMNKGASIARGDILVFLHADTKLPYGWDEMILATLEKGAAAGGFSKRFEPTSLLLSAAAIMSNLRARLLGVYFGDSTIFVQKSVFYSIGGYASIPLMEDVDFSKRLKKNNIATKLISPPVITSSRRFTTFGEARMLWFMFLLRMQYSFGVSPEKLAERYAKGK